MKPQNALVRLAAAGVFVSILAYQAPAQAASDINQVEHFIDCLGLMFSDPARHATECGPGHEFFIPNLGNGSSTLTPADLLPPAPPVTETDPPSDEDCETSTSAILPATGGAAILRVDCPIDGEPGSFRLSASVEPLLI